ncbi:hypothetical protein HPB50_003338 [Hyalomma asiaticum]|uniref:Uncharacterized protein n=1 Tax=Hyalomma asiaticum TaxID=266040 RepID=A0ACB7SQY8_HYAAI|nr:hypothetical protein HPB50_003338 [Hyalomma asiaticum]
MGADVPIGPPGRPARIMRVPPTAAELAAALPRRAPTAAPAVAAWARSHPPLRCGRIAEGWQLFACYSSGSFDRPVFSLRAIRAPDVANLRNASMQSLRAPQTPVL